MYACTLVLSLRSGRATNDPCSRTVPSRIISLRCVAASPRVLLCSDECQRSKPGTPPSRDPARNYCGELAVRKTLASEDICLGASRAAKATQNCCSGAGLAVCTAASASRLARASPRRALPAAQHGAPQTRRSDARSRCFLGKSDTLVSAV